jgi:hypothetical protein
MARAFRLTQRKEKIMITLYDYIGELWVELRGCHFTRRERVAANAELATAIAEQAELDRAFDRALTLISGKAR